MEALTKPLHSIKGIGPTKAKSFGKLGLKSLEDVLYHFPRNYKDKSEITKIANTQTENTYTVQVFTEGKITEVKTKRGLLISRLKGVDETGRITAVWYNNRYIKNSFEEKEELLIYGKVRKIGTDLVIEVAEYEKAASKESLNLMRIAPEYPLTEGLGQKDIRKVVHQVLEMLGGMLPDVFPEELRRRFNISEINFSINNIHFPESLYNLELAKRRFKFEELFILQSGLIHIKKLVNEEKKGVSFNKACDVFSFIEQLPFKLTGAQLKVLSEIFKDMEEPKVMNRLIQGDVGSGKTIVALLALYKCVGNGYQGILMAPTEILAEQHLDTLDGLFKGAGISYGIIKGGMSAKEKRAMLEKAEQGTVDIVVGTHALIEDNVQFKKLGLVITDEQHRFGVRQRASLSSKGSNPDVMVMTATPIPRTLSLILYGDLDISIIDELPPGRKKIETYFVDSSKKERLFNFVKKEIAEGRQAYVVCPLVEESEKLDLNSAVEYSQELEDTYFRGISVGLLHGKMKPADKNEIMDRFKGGEIKILVSTTVIEVGVNVPNATIMIIENAERFGLAQLHQLRGRVGRGSAQSYCILVSDNQSNHVRDRLQYMTKTENGFDIAEKDLENRGSGEVLGQRQHGMPELKIADLFKDMDLIKLAKEAVEYIY